MASIGVMIEQIDGLRDTNDLTAWENEFVTDIVGQYLTRSTKELSSKQVDHIERIWKKHFA